MKGIKVLKKNGQHVLSQLRSLKLLSKSNKIKSEGDFLIIPIDNPSPVELNLGLEFEIVETDFISFSPPVQSLHEYISEKLPLNISVLVPRAFDTVGQIAIIDLPEELLSYGSTIAAGIMSSNSNIKSVFAKGSQIKGSYRIRELIHIGGEDNTETIHQEFGIKFLIDIREVYFSPRLSNEHNRISQLINEGDQVLDMFTATGIFPLHFATSHICDVVALDINCKGLKLLEKNLDNLTLKGKITVVCQDAREFTSDLKFDKIIMNHPSAAIDFLHKALELLKEKGIVFLYAFVPKKNMKLIIKEMLGSYQTMCELQDIHVVRAYSPVENHVCIQLRKF